jgi:hypothetical protein
MVMVKVQRRWLWAALASVLGLVGFVLVWFQPQKLFIDDRVDEPLPVVAGPRSTESDEPPEPPAPVEPVELARGELGSRDHHTSGVARVLELPDGARVLRFEGLDTSNGPDLYVYLTSNPPDGEEGAFDDDYVSLGRLKGNQGDQNYDVPAEVDLARHSTVVIWCDRFDSAFGAAGLV